jgi:hypothetical protein
MNTIGKILVILNLVFALVVGGFLVIDFGTRTNWRTAYENLKREMLVGETNINTSGKTLQELNNQVRRVEADNAELKQRLADEAKVHQAKLNEHKVQLNDAIMQAKDADLNAQKAINQKDTLKEEVKALTNTVQNRDQMLLDLQEKNKHLRTEAIAKEAMANTTQERNQGLLAKIQELERKIALRDAGVGGDKAFAKDPSAPNPPTNYVKGRIEAIDSVNSKLVTISVGTDHGLKQDQTLEVFRMSPQPLWLGRIRIVDAREHAAVGRLVPGVGNRGGLKVGDIVASSISPQAP